MSEHKSPDDAICPDEERSFVVGLDYGHTGFGFSVGNRTSRKTHNLTGTWSTGASGLGKNEAKNLTSVLYEVDRDSDRVTAIAHGYDAFEKYTERLQEEGPKAFNKYIYLSNFKMLLFKGKADATITCPRTQKVFSVARVITDHLRLAVADLKTFLKDHYRQMVDLSSTLVCMTVPVVWKDNIKDLMIQIAYNSGLISTRQPSDEQFQLVYEPEAAALQVINEAIELDRPFPDGSILLIADCGGGTVDFTAHYYERSKLRELVSSTGGPFGSTFVDIAFWDLMRRKFGAQFIERFALNHPLSYARITAEWIEQKKAIKSFDKVVRIPLGIEFVHAVRELAQDNAAHISASGKVVLTSEELQEIFKETFDGIISCTKEQLDKLHDLRHGPQMGKIFIVMVGGYSENRLLEEKVKEKFESRQVHVQIAKSASLAVLHGAAFYGIDPSAIKSRCVKMSFGVACNVKYKSKFHDRDRVIFDEETKSLRVQDAFFPFVVAEEEIEVGGKRVHTFHPAKADQRSVTIKVLSTLRNPKIEDIYQDSQGVYKHATFDLPLPDASAGLNRKVDVTFVFGKAILEVVLENRDSGEKKKFELNFHEL